MKNPRSAGCIDLVDNDDSFFSTLKEYENRFDRIPLKVDYSSIPNRKVKY